MSSARKFFIVAIVITLLAWTGFGFYYFYRAKVSKTSSAVATRRASTSTQQDSGQEDTTPRSVFGTSPEESIPDELANNAASEKPLGEAEWVVYKNEEFGYQISYPDVYKARDQGAVGTTVLNLTNFVAASGSSLPTIGIKIVNTPYKDLETRMWKLAKSGYTVQAASIAGVGGLRVSGKRSGTEEMVYEALFPAADGQSTIRVITAMEEVVEEYLKVYSRMLESFSFF